MTMISKKDFTSSNYRLFMLPAFTRAFLFKSSPLGELSYNTKKAPGKFPMPKIAIYYTNSSTTSIAASPLRRPILTILV